MFTGIVEDLGEVEAIDHQGDFARIHVRSSVVTTDARPGDSICVSGVCLTVTGLFYSGGTTTVSPGGDDPCQTPPAHEGADHPRMGGLPVPPSPPGRPLIPPGPPGGGQQTSSMGGCLPASGAPAPDHPRRPPSPPAPIPPGPSGPEGFTADVMGETLRHSSLKSLSPGTKVNLERSVRLEDRLGGHLVQGHTDGTGTIQSRVSHADWDVVRVSLPASLARYVVHKGSITVDGVSLTVSALSPAEPSPVPPDASTPGAPASSATPGAPASSATPATPASSATPIPPSSSAPSIPAIPTDNWFEISLIPETLKRTTLGTKQPGDEVNLEVDVIAKYVERLIGGTR